MKQPRFLKLAVRYSLALLATCGFAVLGYYTCDEWKHLLHRESIKEGRGDPISVSDPAPASAKILLSDQAIANLR